MAQHISLKITHLRVRELGYAYAGSCVSQVEGCSGGVHPPAGPASLTGWPRESSGRKCRCCLLACHEESGFGPAPPESTTLVQALNACDVT